MNRATFIIPLFGFLLIALVAGWALFGMLGGQQSDNQLPSALPNKPAPSTILPDLDGKTANLNQFAGQPVMVNYFASWCAPCRAEAPALGRLSKRIKIVGIAYKDRREDTMKFLTEYGNPFSAILVDKDGMAAISWGGYGVPETFILDKNGIVLMRHAGPITRAVLEQEIEKILADLGL